jgi:signal transduction histidine kinase
VQENFLSNVEEESHPGQLFLECGSDGRVYWMNNRARQRLGDCSTLAPFLREEDRPALERYLRDCAETETLQVDFHWDAARAIPLVISCVVRAGDRRLLSAEARERATDRTRTAEEELLSMQSRILANYFRLLRAQQTLDSRLRRTRRNPGAVLLEQMERERTRLARDLHTGTGQLLAAINVHLDLLERLEQLPPEAVEYLGRIRALAHQAGVEIRSISHRLHAPEWQSLALGDALRALWNTSGIPESFQGSLDIGDLEPEPREEVRIAIYRIAQEALSNAVRHAHASSITVELKIDHGTLQFRVEDNGHGFDVPRQKGEGIGLRSIAEQAANVGGRAQIHSSSEGTKLEVAIPLEASDE